MVGVNLNLCINLRRTIVIDFIIVNLFRVGIVVLPFKKKGFLRNLCVLCN
jgi:hypothetical protein